MSVVEPMVIWGSLTGNITAIRSETNATVAGMRVRTIAVQPPKRILARQ